MKNKKRKGKGFTLIELLVVIVIVGILSLIAVVATTKYIDKAKLEKEDQNIITAQLAAESYTQANKKYLPRVIGERREVSFKELSSTNYLKQELKNKKDESCMNKSYVQIIKVDKDQYVYKPFIYCGNENRPTIPESTTEPDINISINDGTTQTSDVSSAKFTIELKGDKNDDNVKIVSYNYHILAKDLEADNSKANEVFNSGDLQGNKLSKIRIEDVALSQYVDYTGHTEITVTASLLNEKGDAGESEAVIKIDDSSSSTIYKDEQPPICPTQPSEREGEPALDEWYNKANIGAGKRRTIILKCNDQNGSGCKRDKFSKTWPTSDTNIKTIINDKITISDNSKYSDDTVCDVRVNIDVTSPEIKVLEENNFAKEVKLEADGNVKKLEPSKSITSTDEFYNNLVYIDDNNHKYKWLNKKYYPNGMTYTIETSDDVDIKNISWKVNEPGNLIMSKIVTTEHEAISVNVDDPNTIPASMNYQTRTAGGKKIHRFNIKLTEEGARYGQLLITDRAGNKAIITFEAYIDLTPPEVPVIRMYKWKNNSSEPKSTANLQEYTSGTWSNKKVYTVATNAKDNFEFSHFEYNTRGKEGTKNNQRGGKKSITKDGISNISYSSCDKAGNCTDFNNANSKAEVKIDTVKPTITVTPKVIENYVKNGSATCYNSVSVDAHKNNATVSQDSNGNITIRSDEYKNLVNGWMNNTNYPKGVAYNISMSDNISELYGYKWETSSDVKTNNVQVPSDSSLTSINAKTYGSDNRCLVLVGNGKRYARLYVRDKAGNYSFAHLYANIDTVKPTGTCSFKASYTKDSKNSIVITPSVSESGVTEKYKFVSSFENSPKKYNFMKCGNNKYTPTMKLTDQAGNTNTVSCTNSSNKTSTITPACCASTKKTTNCGNITWGKCSKTCGGGKRDGTRSCVTKSLYNGQECPKESETVSGKCNTQECCLTPEWGGADDRTAIYSGSSWGNGFFGHIYGNYCMTIVSDPGGNAVKVTTKNTTQCNAIINSNYYWNVGCTGWVYRACFEETKTKTYSVCNPY